MSARSLFLVVTTAGWVAAAGVSSLAQVQSRPAQEQPAQGQAGRGTDLEEVTIKADAVIGIRLETTIDSEHAKLEDRVVGRVTRDVNVKGRTAIPAGARIEGYVAVIERSPKSPDRASRGAKPAASKEGARIGLRFTTLVLNDGKMRLPIQTQTVFRTAELSAGQTAARVGTGVVVGAILGAVIGGRKGAVIGGSAGAAGGAATTAAGSDRGDVTIAAGTALTVRLTDPLIVLVERLPDSR